MKSNYQLFKLNPDNSYSIENNNITYAEIIKLLEDRYPYSKYIFDHQAGCEMISIHEKGWAIMDCLYGPAVGYYILRVLKEPTNSQ